MSRKKLVIPEEDLAFAHPELIARNGEINDVWSGRLEKLGWLQDLPSELHTVEEWAKYLLELEQATQSYKELIAINNEDPTDPTKRSARLACIIKRVARDAYKAGQTSKNHESISIGDAFREVKMEMDGMDDDDKLAFAIDRIWSWCKLSYGVGEHYDKHLIPMAERLKSYNQKEKNEQGD